MSTGKQQRDRGLILTPQGRQKLQAEIDRLGISSDKYAVHPSAVCLSTRESASKAKLLAQNYQNF